MKLDLVSTIIPVYNRSAMLKEAVGGGWTDRLGIRRAMENYSHQGLVGYRFPHPLSLFGLWRGVFFS